MRLLVKIGGAPLEERAAREHFAAAVRSALAQGHELVLVHGGGNQVRRLCRGLGIEDRYEGGLRVTDEPTAEVVVAVLGGQVNRVLVAELVAGGTPAVGLTGADGGLFSASKLVLEGRDLGYVGEVDTVDPRPVEHLLAGGFVPVVATVAPLAPGRAGARAHLYNINADQAAAALAWRLGADALLFLSDVPGVLDAEGQLLAEIDPERLARLESTGAVRAGMLPKLDAAFRAARAKPDALVKIAAAARADPIVAALDGGPGTRIRAARRANPPAPAGPAPRKT